MIVVENLFKLIVTDLPPSVNQAGDEFEPYFSFGDDKELNYFLSLKRDKSHYPLIWMTYPTEEIHSKNKVELREVSFILAVETRTDLLNRSRFETTYKKILEPLFDNFRSLIESTNNINCSEDIRVVKHPNYSNEKLPGVRESLKSSEQHKTVDIWDAIKVTFDLTIKGICYRSRKTSKLIQFGDQIVRAKGVIGIEEYLQSIGVVDDDFNDLPYLP